MDERQDRLYFDLITKWMVWNL